MDSFVGPPPDIYNVFKRLTALAVVFAIVFNVVSHYFKKTHNFKPGLKKIPSMKGLPFFGNAFHVINMYWPFKNMSPNVYTLQATTGLSKIFNKDGIFITTVPFGTYATIFTPDKVEKLLKSMEVLNKPFEYTFFENWLGQGLITSRAVIWKTRRKTLTPAFHFKILDSYLPIMYETSQTLIENFKKHNDGKPFLINDYVSRCTMDVICQTAMGYSANSQKGPSEYAKAVQELGEVVFYRMLRPWIWPRFLFRLSSSGRKFQKANDSVQNLIKKLIKDRKAEMLERKDDPKRLSFMDIILRQHLEDGRMNEDDVKDEINTFMFAGQDTTAVGIMWSLLLIGNHPEVQEKIVQELEETIGLNCDYTIEPEDLKKLKYLECVVKEAQRLYPSIPSIGRYMDAPFTIDDMIIPKGAVAVILVRGLHCDPEQFPEPEKFKPERFLPENSVGRHPYAFIPFSAGPRNCLGQKFAMQEEKTVLANILRNFVVTSVQQVDEIPVSQEIAGRPAIPIQLKILPRKQI